MASPDSSSCQDVRALPPLVSDGTLVNSPVKGYVILLCYSSHGLALFWSVGGADLASCGGSGLVRFWNTVHSDLVAVFTAHKDIGSIIMTMTACGRYLITADMEGTLKTWGIQEYCLLPSNGVTNEAPELLGSLRPHMDCVTHLETCLHGGRLLLLSASADCSVALSYLPGDTVGVFGQVCVCVCVCVLSHRYLSTSVEEG
ncbi:unnamed protein product [Oncorhynchus mykiss]|uniref:Uncharacterized protein n=1 Tax=Oncorhynchus mykiss TaxID=8022 RepID=A0A060ZA30_ONCMY|nr:unnamed protein product [Oncorhynchus mykiss]